MPISQSAGVRWICAWILLACVPFCLIAALGNAWFIGLHDGYESLYTRRIALFSVNAGLCLLGFAVLAGWTWFMRLLRRSR